MNRNDCKYLVVTLLMTLFLYNHALSQIEYPGIPYGILYDSNRNVDYVILDPVTSIDKDRYSDTDNRNAKFKLDYFAYTINVNINPYEAGKWDIIHPATRIWRLGITSAGAKSLALTLDPFLLLPGAKLFIYTPDGSHRSGAFTLRNNKPTGVLSLTSLPGDSMIIELQTHTSAAEYGQLTISTVSIGFKHEIPDKDSDDEWFGRSAECHIDINCIDDPQVQYQKYSTCRLIIERTDGRVRCTGSLLNNTSENGLPYVLTASHCITDMYAANHTIAYFDYESPYCQGPDGEIRSISGSYLRSRANTLDFALIELAEKPPVDYYPVFSGWDATGDDFITSYTIHHPQGDVKKFASDSNLVQEGSFAYFDPGTHWLIPDYEIGTTEAGSSGGPLFDINNRIVGTLSGGGLECTTPIYDYYQKFSEEWDSYPDADVQLKSWLDPFNTGIRILGSIEPYQGLTEMITNIQSGDSLEIMPVSEGWGYISGHNSLHSTVFAEHFFRNGSKYIYALRMNVAKLFIANISSTLSILIWDGEDKPQDIVFEKELYLYELTAEQEAYIRLDTLILVDRNFFVGYSIDYLQPTDTFAVYTAIHNNDNENSASMWRGNGWEQLTDGSENYHASLAINPLVLDFYPIPETEYGKYPFNEVTLYPNPTYDNLQILLKNRPDGDVILTVYDLIGNEIHKQQIFQPEPNFQFQTGEILKQGMFILEIEYDGKTAIKKFVKLQ